MGVKKSIKKLFSEPAEMRIKEIENILAYYGYIKHRTAGSHHQFRREGFDIITIPVHVNKVKKIYLKLLKKIIIKYFDYII